MTRLLIPVFGFLLVACNSVSPEVDQPEIDNPSAEDVVSSAYGSNKIYWNYETEFSLDEQVKLQTWILEVMDAVSSTLGYYPFDIHVFFHGSDRDVPVAFGHTKRGKNQSVHFYVNPSFPLEDFNADWTAQHEISHLSIPFVGRNNSWFAEGFATYLSRQIMIEQGYFTEESFDEMYLSRIGECMKYYGSCTRTHVEVSDSLKESYNYGDMYWGSSSFFFTADSLLQETHDKKFREVVMLYQNTNRLKDKSLKELIASLDAIIQDDLFTKLMWAYRNDPSCEVMKGY